MSNGKQREDTQKRTEVQNRNETMLRTQRGLPQKQFQEVGQIRRQEQRQDTGQYQNHRVIQYLLCKKLASRLGGHSSHRYFTRLNRYLQTFKTTATNEIPHTGHEKMEMGKVRTKKLLLPYLISERETNEMKDCQCCPSREHTLLLLSATTFLRGS